MGIIACIIAAVKGRNGYAIFLGIWTVIAIVLTLLGVKYAVAPGALFLIIAIGMENYNKKSDTDNQAIESNVSIGGFSSKEEADFVHNAIERGSTFDDARAEWRRLHPELAATVEQRPATIVGGQYEFLCPRCNTMQRSKSPIEICCKCGYKIPCHPATEVKAVSSVGENNVKPVQSSNTDSTKTICPICGQEQTSNRSVCFKCGASLEGLTVKEDGVATISEEKKTNVSATNVTPLKDVQPAPIEDVLPVDDIQKGTPEKSVADTAIVSPSTPDSEEGDTTTSEEEKTNVSATNVTPLEVIQPAPIEDVLPVDDIQKGTPEESVADAAIVSPSTPEKETFECPECGKTIPEESEFCCFCGVEIIKAPPPPPPVQFCRKCGFKLVEGSVFCSKCGTKI